MMMGLVIDGVTLYLPTWPTKGRICYFKKESECCCEDCITKRAILMERR